MDTRHVEKSTYSRSLMWQKTESEGYIQQTLHLPKIHGLAPGAGAYQGAGGVSVQLPAGSSVRTQIEALSGQPGLEYLGELGQRSDIDWQRVEVINQSLNINKQGLTPEGMIVVAIAVAIATAGTGAGLVGTTTATATGTVTTLGGVTLATTTAATATAAATATTFAAGAAISAGFTALATIAATSLINNGGDLGETLKELGSKDTLRAVAVSAATAGLTQGALDSAGLGATANAANSGNQAAQAADKISLTQKTGTALARGTVQGLSAAMAESAILGTSFEEALGRHLTSSLIASLGALGANEIGGAKANGLLTAMEHKIAHAVLGCAVGAASADSSAGCAPGAVGAVIGELVAEWYAESTGYDQLKIAADDKSNPNHEALKKELAEQKHLMAGIAQLAAVGGTAVLLQSGAEQLQLAKMTANNAVVNNRQLHVDETKLIKRLANERAASLCADHANCDVVKVAAQYADAMERVAEMNTDTQNEKEHQAYLERLAMTAQIDGSVGQHGGYVDYLGILQEAQQMLAPYMGQAIVVRGKAVTDSNGQAVTYFSATEQQKQNSSMFGLFGSQSMVTPGMAARDAARLEYNQARLGSTIPDTTIEETLFGMRLPSKGAGLVVKQTERNAVTALPGTVKASDQTLLKNAGATDAQGNALLDMSKLTNEQKRVVGEQLFGPNTVKQIVPDGQQIARMQGQGSNGIDELYKVNRPDVDYVNIEYKFVGQDNKTGAQVLGNTTDGKQGSTSWMGGSNRIENAVGSLDAARAVKASLESGRVESWVVTVRPDGSTAVQVLDALGKPKPIDHSKIILPNLNLSGAQK